MNRIVVLVLLGCVSTIACLAAFFTVMHPQHVVSKSVPTSLVRALKGHLTAAMHRAKRASGRQKSFIAVCVCTKHESASDSLNATNLQRVLIPSLSKTITPSALGEFEVHLYVGIRRSDAFWTRHVSKLRKPAWLVVHTHEFEGAALDYNELLGAAHADGAEYIVRVGDDVEFASPGWLLMGMNKLQTHSPPNVGVTRPSQPEHIFVTITDSYKPVGLRKIIRVNMQRSWASLGVNSKLLILNETTLERNKHGTPVLRDIYRKAFTAFPKADTYTYFNNDLLADGGLVQTADAIISAIKNRTLRQRFLAVGKRTNVDWKHRKNTTVEHEFDFGRVFRTGTLFWDNAQDYFMITRQTFDWDKIPAFVIGRPGYDNWLVDRAYHSEHIDLIDTTRTVRMVHQTDSGGNTANGGNRPGIDKHYNHVLGKGQWDHGDMSNSAWYTEWVNGSVVVRHRNKILPDEKENLTGKKYRYTPVSGVHMIHRTHMEIFGQHHPTAVATSWAHDWINYVYRPNLSTQTNDWKVEHHTDTAPLHDVHAKHLARQNLSILTREVYSWVESGKQQLKGWLPKESKPRAA